VRQQFDGVDLLHFSKGDLLSPGKAERRQQWLCQQLETRAQHSAPPFHSERQLVRSDAWLQLEPLERRQVLAWAAQLGPEVLRAKGEVWLVDAQSSLEPPAAAARSPGGDQSRRRAGSPLALHLLAGNCCSLCIVDPRMSDKSTGALAVPFLGVLASLQLIDPTVANTALVKAEAALHMQGATLAQAATVLLMGFLGDRLGRRRVLMGNLLLSIAGDGIALAAPGAPLFLLGRALVGIGVGAILALTFASARSVSRPDQLGKALDTWNLLIIAGFIGGSLLGGVLTDSSWRLALGLVPLIALLCLPLVPLLLPEMPANAALRADWPGLVSIALAMVLFLIGVSHAVSGLTAPQFLFPTLGGVAVFGAHVWIERGRQEPIFPWGSTAAAALPPPS
jgi:MFS family permease